MNSKLFNRDFSLVLLGQIVSLFGNAILRFALPLYLLRETGSAALFGLVTACSFLPMIVLSFLGGVLADRANKRNIMVILDFLTAAILLLLSLLLGKLALVPLLLVTLMLLYGISGSYQPTVQASIPALLPPAHILAGTALVNQVGALAGLLGPLVGGMLFGAFGIRPILALCTLCFLLSAIMELFIRIPHEKRARSNGLLQVIKGDLRESLQYIKVDNPLLLRILLLVALFNLLLTALLIVGIPVLVVETLNMSDAKLGFAQGALALGGLLGGGLTALLGQRLRLEKSHLLLLVCALALGLMGLPFLMGLPPLVCYTLICVLSMFLMSFATAFSILLLATVQAQTPPQLVGKIIALMLAISLSAQPLGQAIYGLLFERFAQAPGPLLLLVGLLSAVIALAAKKLFTPSHRQQT